MCFSHACFSIRLFTHRQTSVVKSEQTFFPAVFCMFSSHVVWLLNSTSLGGGLKPLCLPQLGMSNGSSQGYHTLRFVIQYVFSAKYTVQWLRNAGQSAEVLKYQVGFSTALFWCSFPPPSLRSRNERIAPKERSESSSIWMGCPHGPLSLIWLRCRGCS